MNRTAILMPCWRSPELLRAAMPSLQKTIGQEDMIIVILNEADPESIQFLDEQKVKHIDVAENYGPSAVDLAIPFMNDIGFKYVANVNSDMLFSYGWVDELISLLETNYPCSTSASLIEPQAGGGNAIEHGIDFFDPSSHELFNEFVSSGKYSISIGNAHYGHPILVKTVDFMNVNGYSDNMDEQWIMAQGRALDDWFAYRLYKLHNNEFKFINSDKAMVYHAISLNTRKNPSPHHAEGGKLFRQKVGMTAAEFYNTLQK